MDVSKTSKKHKKVQEKLEPKNVFPELHKKTMYKAAMEYTIGLGDHSSRSNKVPTFSIERQVLDANFNYK